MSKPGDALLRGPELKSVYGPDDLDGLAHLGTLPGEAPFVRGPYRTMYRGRPWTIRQYAGHADAVASNLAYRRALEQGAQGISVAFDLPTHRGYDSDDAEAAADVGMAGVALDSVDDMHRLFAGIALNQVSVSMTMSGAVLPVMAAFLVAAEETGVPASQLRGTIQNDILKEFLVRNAWVHGPGPSLRIATDVVEYLAQHAPRLHCMSISGYHFQEAGAPPVLELALTLANARTYLEQIRARGLDLDTFCGKLSFFFGVGKPFFVEIAKLRAARLLWHEIVTGMGGTSAQGTALRMHCQTSGWSLSAREPANNIARTAVEAMAAIFGGTQSLHTNAFDEALALPGDEAARLARNTQLILQHEFGLCDVADPWAGSYMMESLTAEIADGARAMLAQIEAQGGMLAALDSGWIQAQVHRGALDAQARIDAGEAVVVGVNRYVEPDSAEPACRVIDGGAVRASQKRRLAALRAARDDGAVTQALTALRHAARSGVSNLLACTVDAMRCRATVGECTRALLDVWPRHASVPRHSAGVYGPARATDAAWQAACARVAVQGVRLGRKPRILLAKLGQDGHDRGARAVAAALTDAGFDAELTPLFQSAEAVARRAIQGCFDIVGVSTLGGAHRDLVPGLLRLLRARSPDLPVFAGGIIPHEDVQRLQADGVRGIFGPGTPMEAIVAALAGALEAKRRGDEAAGTGRREPATVTDLG
ncbi:methylmalonyl-CoA mutase [Cupriavidus pinatubonensis]|uniref:Methylmalonyl-CoA mutase n=1 Tax=Cupriavidus pinatubonensis TaxID=248026 RepID=A0ABM8W8M5_9BURK|nr:methylmalonyl-CoA mutase [Cupriavidus pinatubonensis]CAG9163566.1 Methylmalonyl-CoA mutase [Cupriavidus pinatubonensis]